MLRALIRVIVLAGAVFLLSHTVPGIVVDNFITALIVAFVRGIVCLTIRPVLKILTLPVTLLTFGVFSFVLNALLFWAVSALVPGFTIHGFIPALEGSLILSLVSWALHVLL